jgi:hypothetical protein
LIVFLGVARLLAILAVGLAAGAAALTAFLAAGAFLLGFSSGGCSDEGEGGDDREEPFFHVL